MSSSQPTNASEWQLYKVLQRANLLQYYDTFVAQGGDDVQQLCEAGEEEFLEIMALVGMASKPLHVRRLQKALQEWVANPAAFQATGTNTSLNSPMREPPTHVYSLPIAPTDVGTPASSSWNRPSTPQKSVSPVSMVVSSRAIDLQEMQMKKQTSSSPQPTPALMDSQIQDIAMCAEKLAANLPFFEAKPLNMKKDVNKQIYELISEAKDNPSRMDSMRKYGAIYRRFDSARAYEKPMSLHEAVMALGETDDPDRLDECRKLGAIYGRFDSNRKKDKPMSMHEICVNEASAQLCYHMPNLLTRREDLFPLARQVVKDSGYQYSKGHSRAADVCPTNPSKRPKLDTLTDAIINGMTRLEREDRLVAIGKELSEISEHQEKIVCELDNAKEGRDADKIEMLQTSLEQMTNKHLQLLTEQSDLLRKQSYEMYGDFDGASDKDDSNFDNSGTPSPSSVQAEKTELGTNPAMAAKSAILMASQMGSMTQGMKNSLFDEGLRIAQQYGLGEFAEELKTLQGPEDEVSTNHVASFRRKGSYKLNSNGGRVGLVESSPKSRGRKRQMSDVVTDTVGNSAVGNSGGLVENSDALVENSDSESNCENGFQQEEIIIVKQEVQDV